MSKSTSLFCLKQYSFLDAALSRKPTLRELYFSLISFETASKLDPESNELSCWRYRAATILNNDSSLV